MKKMLMVAVLACLTATLEAQVRKYSFTLSANYPVIPSVVRYEPFTTTLPDPVSGYVSYTTNVATIRESYETKPGIDFSAQTEIALGKRWFLSTGLGVSYLRYKMLVTIEGLNTELEFDPENTEGDITLIPIGQPIGSIGSPGWEGPILPSSENNGKTSTLYVQVPLLAGTSFIKDKLSVSAGLNFSYLVAASTYRDEIRFNGTTLQVSEVKDTNRDGFNSLLASAALRASYQLTRSLAIDATANKFLSPIYSTEDVKEKAKYNVFSMGISYCIGRQ